MNAIITQGLSKEEYNEIKSAAKSELSFKVSVRYHKQKYCYGSIDIRPYNKPYWNEDETKEVYNFVKDHKLFCRTMPGIPEKNVPYVYHQGFGYLTMIRDS